MKKALLAKLPKGAIHKIAQGEDEDLLYDGIAEDFGEIKTFLTKLKNARDPYLTEDLDTLEKEYGILKNPSLTETERRAVLASLVYAPAGSGGLDYLQDQLHAAGFTDLYVYDNSPAVDPDNFVGSRHVAYCASPPLYLCASPPLALCSSYGGGEYVVNGDIYDQSYSLTVVCASPPAHLCASPPLALCGDFISVKTPITYDPTVNWNLVFFVGGAVTRDPVTDEIIDIQMVEYDETKRELLRRIILRCKPLQTWGALCVNFTVEVWQDDNLTGDVITDSESSGTSVQDVTW